MIMLTFLVKVYSEFHIKKYIFVLFKKHIRLKYHLSDSSNQVWLLFLKLLYLCLKILLDQLIDFLFRQVDNFFSILK